MDDRGRITEWQAYFHASGGDGFVYLRDQVVLGKVQQILERLKNDPANGIRSLWNRTQLAARRRASVSRVRQDFVDGFYSGDGHDVVTTPSASKGGHGFAPNRPALHASFILSGPSARRAAASASSG